MKLLAKASIALLLTQLSISGCSGSAELKQDPYNAPDEQRSRASQAQDELSSETTDK